MILRCPLGSQTFEGCSYEFSNLLSSSTWSPKTFQMYASRVLFGWKILNWQLASKIWKEITIYPWFDLKQIIKEIKRIKTLKKENKNKNRSNHLLPPLHTPLPPSSTSTSTSATLPTWPHHHHIYHLPIFLPIFSIWIHFEIHLLPHFSIYTHEWGEKKLINLGK